MSNHFHKVFNPFRLALLFQDLSRLFKNHSGGGFRVRLLHRRALLLKQVSFNILHMMHAPEIVKLADQPGHGLPHHVDPIKVHLSQVDQVKDVEVPVKEHRGGGGISFQRGHQSRLFARSQNLMVDFKSGFARVFPPASSKRGSFYIGNGSSLKVS